MTTKEFTMDDFDLAAIEGYATWWQMQLPSGNVEFGKAKTDMLGYEKEHFKTYHQFTELLHEEDYEKAMQAMKDHLTGKEPVYETTYRIRHKNGTYIKFYDCGQLVNKKRGEQIVMGFVMEINNRIHVKEQMRTFKEGLLKGKPSFIEVIKELHKKEETKLN